MKRKNELWYEQKKIKDAEARSKWEESRYEDDVFVAEYEVIEFYLHKIYYFSKSVPTDPTMIYYGKLT